MVQDNRTFVCSVLFLDIVAYSEQPVAGQLEIKQRFNALLGAALRNVADNDRIVLDTGDGAAVSFLGNPEEALFVAIELRDALGADDPVPFEVRFGINLGPVRMINDINHRTNIIGNGINVAQRVMSFATPGQILVSRSYFEVVACLSNDYAQLFSYSGSHTDKHVHEHEVYVVGDSGPGLRPPTLIQYEGPSASGLGQRIKQSWESVQGQVQLRLQKHVGARWPMVASLGGVLVVTGIIAVAAALNEPDGSAEATAAELALPGDDSPAADTPAALATAGETATSTLVAAQLVLLAGCESMGGVVEGVGGAVGGAVDSAGTLFLSDGQRILRAGIQQYEEGQFAAATNNLRSALETDLPTKDQVQAHKYLAFIACVEERTTQCRNEFRAALSIDPAMTLAPSEAGNPLWDPVFQAERERANP